LPAVVLEWDVREMFAKVRTEEDSRKPEILDFGPHRHRDKRLVRDASVVQNATEAVSQTRLGHHMRAMVGPLNFIRLNLREHFRPQVATTLPETDLFCCVMEIDVGRQGNNCFSTEFEKTPVWISLGKS